MDNSNTYGQKFLICEDFKTCENRMKECYDCIRYPKYRKYRKLLNELKYKDYYKYKTKGIKGGK